VVSGGIAGAAVISGGTLEVMSGAPYDAGAYINRGIALKELGRTDEAVASYDASGSSAGATATGRSQNYRSR
jgi:hypothetical protein